MIRVKYEEYYNDYRRRHLEKDFSGLKELEEWIFGQMKQDYSDKNKSRYVMWWCYGKRGFMEEPSAIEFQPEFGGPEYWIHEIDFDGGIAFTDGKYTAGVKHWSSQVMGWLEHCYERQSSPVFNFVD